MPGHIRRSLARSLACSPLSEPAKEEKKKKKAAEWGKEEKTSACVLGAPSQLAAGRRPTLRPGALKADARRARERRNFLFPNS